MPMTRGARRQLLLIAMLAGCATTPPDHSPAGPTSSVPRVAAAPTEHMTEVGAAASSSSSALSAADAPLTPEEKSFLARGFRISERDESGQRIFCRGYTAAGSRIASEEVCGTVRELREIAQQTQGDLRAGYATSFQSAPQRLHEKPRR